MGSRITSRLAHCFLFLLTSIAISPAEAADELLIYVFENGEPVVGAEVLICDQSAGSTTSDDSLPSDPSGPGTRFIFKTLLSGNLKELADDLGSPMIKALGINIAPQLASYSYGR